MPTDEDNFDETLKEIDEGSEDNAGSEGDADDTLDAGTEREVDDGEGTGQEAAAPGSEAGAVKPSRGEARFQRLSRELRETKERELARQREFDEMKYRLQQMTQPQQETPQQRQQRLDMMTTEERMAYLLQESEARNQQQIQQMRFFSDDRADQQQYAQRMATDKRAEKYRPEVENLLAAFRQQGLNPRREAVYFYVLGQKVANANGKASQASGVRQRAAAQRTNPGNSAGDVGRAQRTRTLEQKLDGVEL
jgi:hypothetical protein